MIVPCPIAARSLSMPDHPAVEAGSRSLSYGELNAAIGRSVIHLDKHGIDRGERVAIRLKDGLDFSIALWSLLRLGAVAVLLNERDPESAVAAAIAATQCKYLLSDRRTGSNVEVIKPRPLTEYLEKGLAARDPSFDFGSFATVVFTSGSEGRPKAVVHTIRNHWRSAEGSQVVIPVSSSTRWAVVIPKYHVGGLSIFFRCFLHGGTIVVPDRNERNLAGLARRNVTHVSVVPTQLGDWLANREAGPYASLETVLVGGASTPLRLRSEAIGYGLPVRFSYGSTEMASQIATTDRNDPDMRPGYVGRVLPHRRVRIAAGELMVGGETRFAGYWSDGGLFAPFDDEGWFATGDLGWLDGDRLIVTGRVDNRFISGGENIHPEEIEEAIIASGLADLAVVVPVSDARFGARPVAYLRPVCRPEDLRAALTNVLPGFKIPKDVRRLPDEMDGSKRDRRALIEEAARLGES